MSLPPTIAPTMDWLALIALALTAFVATNLDDSLVLLLFFGDRRFRARHVFIGQALGVGLLVLISLVAALLALAVPAGWVRLLGLLPIALGIRQLVERRRGADGDGEPSALAPARGESGWRRAAAVAGVTLANGGDNVGVYAPLFAGRPPAETAIMLGVFAVMLAVWLFGALYLARRSAVAEPVQRIGRSVFPYALIAIGFAILAEHFL